MWICERATASVFMIRVNAGCQIIYKDEYEVDGTIDFSKTFTKLSSSCILYCVLVIGGTMREKIKSCVLLSKRIIYIRNLLWNCSCQNLAGITNDNIVNGENQILLSEFGADLEDFQQVKEICFLFEKSEEKEQTNFTIRNFTDRVMKGNMR